MLAQFLAATAISSTQTSRQIPFSLWMKMHRLVRLCSKPQLLRKSRSRMFQFCLAYFRLQRLLSTFKAFLVVIVTPSSRARQISSLRQDLVKAFLMSIQLHSRSCLATIAMNRRRVSIYIVRVKVLLQSLPYS